MPCGSIATSPCDDSAAEKPVLLYTDEVFLGRVGSFVGRSGQSESAVVEAADTMNERSCGGTFLSGRIILDSSIDWPEGTRLTVTPDTPAEPVEAIQGHVIIVGFGLAGRCVADLLDSAGLPYTVVERNPATVVTQRALGRTIILGDAADAKTLIEANLHDAALLALTIPDEEAVLKATSLARRLEPDIYIMARTNYSSKGMQASRLGADEVIKAEQAVALQFYDKLSRRIGGTRNSTKRRDATCTPN